MSPSRAPCFHAPTSRDGVARSQAGFNSQTLVPLKASAAPPSPRPAARCRSTTWTAGGLRRTRTRGAEKLFWRPDRHLEVVIEISDSDDECKLRAVTKLRNHMMSRKTYEDLGLGQPIEKLRFKKKPKPSSDSDPFDLGESELESVPLAQRSKAATGKVAANEDAASDDSSAPRPKRKDREAKDRTASSKASKEARSGQRAVEDPVRATVHPVSTIVRAQQSPADGQRPANRTASPQPERKSAASLIVVAPPSAPKLPPLSVAAEMGGSEWSLKKRVALSADVAPKEPKEKEKPRYTARKTGAKEESDSEPERGGRSAKKPRAAVEFETARPTFVIESPAPIPQKLGAIGRRSSDASSGEDFIVAPRDVRSDRLTDMPAAKKRDEVVRSGPSGGRVQGAERKTGDRDRERNRGEAPRDRDRRSPDRRSCDRERQGSDRRQERPSGVRPAQQRDARSASPTRELRSPRTAMSRDAEEKRAGLAELRARREAKREGSHPVGRRQHESSGSSSDSGEDVTGVDLDRWESGFVVDDDDEPRGSGRPKKPSFVPVTTFDEALALVVPYFVSSYFHPADFPAQVKREMHGSGPLQEFYQPLALVLDKIIERKQMVPETSWPSDLVRALDWFPIFTAQPSVSTSDHREKCSACGKLQPIAFAVSFHGEPYDAFSFEPRTEQRKLGRNAQDGQGRAEPPPAGPFAFGSFCKDKAQRYHELAHALFRMRTQVTDRARDFWAAYRRDPVRYGGYAKDREQIAEKGQRHFLSDHWAAITTLVLDTLEREGKVERLIGGVQGKFEHAVGLSDR
ncbi:hypothetical protein DFJ74DRAFT_202302 [Hyaloraphidium curvatum]|nr:hypothetical protein DFJ74DRAFT_202302 [Hyaloraphidium curvatum]